MNNLTPDVLEYIVVHFLNIKDFISLSSCNKTTRTIWNRYNLWIALFKRDLTFLPTDFLSGKTLFDVQRRIKIYWKFGTHTQIYDQWPCNIPSSSIVACNNIIFTDNPPVSTYVVTTRGDFSKFDKPKQAYNLLEHMSQVMNININGKPINVRDQSYWQMLKRLQKSTRLTLQDYISFQSLEPTNYTNMFIIRRCILLQNGYKFTKTEFNEFGRPVIKKLHKILDAGHDVSHMTIVLIKGNQLNQYIIDIYITGTQLTFSAVTPIKSIRMNLAINILKL